MCLCVCVCVYVHLHVRVPVCMHTHMYGIICAANDWLNYFCDLKQHKYSSVKH